MSDDKFQWTEWRLGHPLTINRIVWDEQEFERIREVFMRDWFGPSWYAGALENRLADFIGRDHAQLVNSGSSALLLATQGLQAQRRWAKGDLILHPACTFPTSCNPIYLAGMTPAFVDVEEGTYNIDMDGAWSALVRYPEIKGAIIPHLLGNSPKIDELKALLGDRPLIEDCCDTLGGKYAGKMVGSFGDAAAFSFYASHHITTAGVGGALLMDDPELYRLVHSMTFWGREFTESGDPYTDFTNRYTYSTVGHDMQITEVQAAFGLAQFDRLAGMNRQRAEQFRKTHDFFRQWEYWLVLPRSHPEAEPSWFGYPVLVKEDAPFDREAFARHLLDHRVEIRPLFTGNITRQPAYKNLRRVVVGALTQSDHNMERAFFLPAWGGMTDEMTDYLFDVVRDFMGKW